MKRTLLTACLFTLPLVGAACTDEPIADEEANLPGDIDNSTDGAGAGGKGDAWDGTHDPARIGRNLNYRLAELPKNGKLDKPVWASRYPNAVGKAPVAWADTYWPSYVGSTNHRWNGRASKSPLEKYDAAFNSAPGCATQPSQVCGTTAKADWDQYFTCAGPAATWHMKNFQSIYEQIDGLDNDNDGKKDECDANDDEGTQGWWGLCHAWTPASLLEPEPQHAVEYQGQRFEVADIKALIQTAYDANDAIMLGGRCNLKEYTPSATTSANAQCDFNAGALHVVLGNLIGINDSALAMDRTSTFEVWNQPIVGYDVTQQTKVDARRAQACAGGTGDRYTFNTSAKELYEVTTVVSYLVEGNASARPLGMNGYVSQDTYHYVLELGSTGKIIGGRFCTGSESPDFLWAPLRISSSTAGRNPNVDWTKIQTLINLSIGDQPTQPPTGNEKTYQNATATAIPDNAPAGTALEIAVPDTFAFKGLSVSVDIEHTWRGDLLVELLKDGTKVATLSDRAGGSADNLTQTYTFTPAQVGGDAARATWSLKVTDTAAQDTGTVKLFKLTFAQ